MKGSFAYQFDGDPSRDEFCVNLSPSSGRAVRQDILLWGEMLGWSDQQLAEVDPALQNLEVARGISELADLDPRPYCEALDRHAAHFRRWLPEAEAEFHADPGSWDNDLVAFRLGMLCQFLEQAVGVRYNEDQREAAKVSYSRPGDLFLAGVLDTGQGTCGNMAVLFHALCWRLRWPVSLAHAGWHEFCRYDNGTRTINVETSNIGQGFFRTLPDGYYSAKYNLLAERVRLGSDLQALSPRRVLGCFFGARGRYWYDQREAALARDDYGRAAGLFPESWLWREKWAHARALASAGGTVSST